MENQSRAHVQYYIANAGYTYEITTKDYGYDLVVNTFDQEGYIDPGSILIQLKASEVLKSQLNEPNYFFDLDTRDYRLWIDEPNPVFLILYEATTRRGYWLYTQRYFKEVLPPEPGAKTIRIFVPKLNKVRTAFFRHARRLKAKVFQDIRGGDLHG